MGLFRWGGGGATPPERANPQRVGVHRASVEEAITHFERVSIWSRRAKRPSGVDIHPDNLELEFAEPDYATFHR